VRVAGVKGAKSLALGKTFSCALDGDANVKCWGFGSGDERPPVAPFTIEGLAGTRRLLPGNEGLCAEAKGPKLLCFTARGDSKVVVEPSLPAKGVVALSVSSGLDPVLKASGEVVLSRRIIDNKGPSVKTVGVPGVKGVVDMAAGSGAFCAVEKGAGSSASGIPIGEISKTRSPFDSMSRVSRTPLRSVMAA